MSAGEIRIADLAKPVLTPAQRAAIEFAEAQPVRFDVETILAAACAKTGLRDFGRDDFRARLAIQCRSIEEDAGLNALGRLGVFANLLRYAENRLRFEDLLRRHPEILETKLERPIIVAGMPRTGTTHLLNLIAADTRLRSLPYWESMEPVPAPGEGAGRDGRDPRWTRCNASYQQMAATMPLIVAMHDMPPEHIHEEIELEELDFASYLLEWLCRPQRWRDHYLALDQRPHYAYMKRVLQALTWMRGPRRWVLKSPQHLEQLLPLLETFPDATIVITHRDPVSVIRSAITMLGYGDRVRRTRVDLAGLADYWIDRVDKLLGACLRDRDALPAAQTIDLPFHEFMADDLGAVARIYERAGLPMTAAARAELDAFIAANPRGKHGQVVYDLRADFGLEPADVRKRFTDYVARFRVRVEN
ncbi:MAG TPA: sulfotransferase [Myxococcota bacterium]|nr:sulfotransferase [Myxococcota bacterium]